MTTVKVECTACKATGLYIGMGERNGAAVVCRRCEGTGAVDLEYTKFTERRVRESAVRVYACNPGIMVGEKEGVCRLEDFGGMPAEDWYAGKPFPKGSEMRNRVCPRWWAQCSGHSFTKPSCDRMLGRCFDDCEQFETKEKCWEEYDK